MNDRSSILAARSYGAGAFVAALLTLLATLGAFLFTPPVAAEVGDKDPLVFRDFHDRETIGAMVFRWTNGASTLNLPQVGSPRAAVARLGLWIPQTRPPVPLTL